MKEETSFLFRHEGEKKEIKKISIEDIQPRIPEVGGTTLVLQRNAKDIRQKDAPDVGALETAAAEQAHQKAKEFFDQIFSELTKEEKKEIAIMVIASNASLDTPDGLKTKHQRAMETADEVIAGLKESMIDFSLTDEQLLNSLATTDGRAVEISELRDLSMIEESPEFTQFLVDKYGTGPEFWVAYETDAEKETRLQMGAEGPEEIADRVNYALSLQRQIAKEYHQANLGKRLIVWAVSHYDAISPFIKKNIVGMDMASYLPVDAGAGITIGINGEREASCVIQDQEINLNKQ